MQVVRDDLWLCVDCLMVAVNGDDSGIEGDDRKRAVRTGVEMLGRHLVPDFDSETEDEHGNIHVGVREFSSTTCDCCGSHLAGSRHRFAVLGA
jgi:hypothetical protein